MRKTMPARTITVLGAGVIGRVYAARLAAAGHTVDLLARGETLDRLRQSGVRTRFAGKAVLDAPVQVRALDEHLSESVREPAPTGVDFLLVCVRRDQVAGALNAVGRIRAAHTVFLQDPGSAWDQEQESWCRAFPGVGGYQDGDVVTYLQIRQQPTTVEAGRAGSPAVHRLLGSAAFPTAAEPQMTAWLAAHAVLMACLGAAINNVGGDPQVLARDRPAMRRLVAAIGEGFNDVKAAYGCVSPAALGALFLRCPQWLAVSYWARALSGPMGTVCIAPHLRATALTELPLLAHDVLSRVGGSGHAQLRQLLGPVSARSAGS